MPAYDKPIVINVDRSGLRNESFGAVIRFNSTDKERIQRFLDELCARDIIGPATVESYNPDHGSPVFYIP